MASELLNLVLAERYRISHEIGRGGMATVYRAQDLKHDRPVALKVLEPHLAAALGTERFLREITLTARLDHAHILPLLDSGEADGVLYYVMPYVDGESLRDRLNREKQLPIDEALQIAREVADALSHAHSHGIVHRDIKPENIMLSGGHARVADFGIARALTAAGGDSLTATGLAIGTPVYMSPEQASGEREADPRADVYSLGCVLYEMLAGQPPYTGATAEAILARKSIEDIPSLRVVRTMVPVAVERAISKALARVPADRFGTARQFADALASAATASPAIPPGTGGSRSLRVGAGVLALAMVAAVLFATNVGGVRTRMAGGAAAARIESLAVLPLENLSGDTTQDYLAAGMHEALITDLGKLHGLRRVTARSSVLRYHKTDKTPRQIGEELGVDAVIAGTVMRSGDRVRITAHLIRASTEEQLWQDRYERDLRDVFALQNEIVSAIAREVELQLSPSERANLARARQVNPQAYQAYLKGRFQLNTLSPVGFDSAVVFFRRAIALDPLEPLAYVGLAEVYNVMELFHPATSKDDVTRAKAAALKALELDETLAEAHVALGNFKGGKEFDFAGADQSYRRALELNPNLADAHITYAQYLTVFGGEQDAIAEWKRGIELDPLSPLYTSWFAGALWEFGRFDDAIAEAQKAIALQPDFQVALFVLGLAYLDMGQHREAIAIHEKMLAKYPGFGFSWALARTYALTGRMAEARKIMARLESGTPGDAPHPWFIASAYTAMGEHEKALDWLEKAYDARILFLGYLGRERGAGFDLRPLRGYPRFKALQRKLNLAG